ncbi:MAG: RNA 2',3'-cyclic phosphodiesterase [Fibrobacterales bacterium]
MRVFLALQIPEDEKYTLSTLLSEYYKHFKTFNWINAINYHVTIHFLGDQSQDSVDELIKTLHNYDFSGLYHPICVSEVTYFKKSDRSTILHLPIDYPNHWIKELYDILKPIVERYCPVTHLNFKPHITIARTKHRLHQKDYEFFETHPEFSTLNPTFLTLYHSTSQEGQIVYKDLARYSLK